MKKQVLAFAIAAATAAPAFADSTPDFYGSLRLKLTDGNESAVDVTNTYSRVGVKGSVDTNMEGVKALYRYEVGISDFNNPDEPTHANEGNIRSRLAFVGLQGDFGTLKVGQDWTPYANAITFNHDIMSSYTPAAVFFGDHYRADSMVSYYSPNFDGFSFALASITDSDEETGAGMDSMEATASYSGGGFGISLGTIQEEADTNADVMSLAVNMTSGDLYAGVTLEQLSDTDTADERTALSLIGKLTVPTGAVIGHYFDSDDATGTSGFAAEYQHMLGDATMVFVEARNVSKDDVDDKQDYSVGLRVDF